MPVPMRRLAAAAAALLLAACSEAADPLGPPQKVQGLLACPNDSTDGTARGDSTCVTYRGIGGISMGGGSAMRIALENPELFDVAVSLGSPYTDLEYFLITVSEISNGGFCPMEQLLANLDAIDAKDDPNTWCGPVTLEELALPESECTGFSGDYNHHYRGPEAGRGGSFNRVSSLEIVHDFAIAYGNPAFYSEDSSYRPPGVPEDHHVPLALSDPARRDEREMRRQTICAEPTVLEGVYDRLYNPEGTFDVITYCDGNGPTNGEYEPGTANFPMEVALAVDYNGNGRRDYGEPVIAHPAEHFEDVGTDGLASRDEPGYGPSNLDPSGDDYHWRDNPTGAEGNIRYDEGEPYDDFGLDGVDGTNDYGEGTGAFDQNPNVEYAFSRSPRRLVEDIDARMLARLHLWADAGIRDFLLSAQITNQFWGSLSQRTSDTRTFRDWSGLAEAAQDEGDYDPAAADLSEARIGRHGYLWYGDPSVCPGVDAQTGRGNHVGTAAEVLDRILTTFAFASARWPDGDFAQTPGAISDLGSPNGAFEDFALVESFDSEALGREVPYVVVLPPDYYRTENRYPVMYFLHGQGQKATDLLASALLMLGPQMTSDVPARKGRRQSDWQKMIIVFADGECQVGECHTGTFYVDHKGAEGESVRHGEAFFELMRLVDAKYRTKVPAMKPR